MLPSLRRRLAGHRQTGWGFAALVLRARQGVNQNLKFGRAQDLVAAVEPPLAVAPVSVVAVLVELVVVHFDVASVLGVSLLAVVLIDIPAVPSRCATFLSQELSR